MALALRQLPGVGSEMVSISSRKKIYGRYLRKLQSQENRIGICDASQLVPYSNKHAPNTPTRPRHITHHTRRNYTPSDPPTANKAQPDIGYMSGVGSAALGRWQRRLHGDNGGRGGHGCTSEMGRARIELSTPKRAAAEAATAGAMEPVMVAAGALSAAPTGSMHLIEEEFLVAGSTAATVFSGLP